MLLFSSPFWFGAGQPLHKIFSLNLIKIVGEVAAECPIWMPFEVLDGFLSFFHLMWRQSKKRNDDELKYFNLQSISALSIISPTHFKYLWQKGIYFVLAFFSKSYTTVNLLKRDKWTNELKLSFCVRYRFHRIFAAQSYQIKKWC